MLNAFQRHSTYLQNLNIRQFFVPVILVLSLLFCFVSHGEHFSLNDHSSESITELNCHLCQQNIADIDTDIKINQPIAFSYSLYLPKVYQLVLHTNYSVSPPLRAPPVKV